VVDPLGDEAPGVLVVDETGFLKKGKQSCGVARQDSGTAGAIANCQGAVFLAYASGEGAAFIDRARALPREWADDPARRAEAGVPEAVRFATTIERAKGMLARAFDAAVPVRWVVADAFSGRRPGDGGGSRSGAGPTLGLDPYAVRTWEAGHRHATLCLLAHASLVVLRRAARRDEAGEKGAPIPA
jgi:SRSO17 transposase